MLGSDLVNKYNIEVNISVLEMNPKLKKST